MDFQSFKTSGYLVAAVSLWVLTGQPTPSAAGGSLGGVAGGLIGGATGTVGQIAGSATGAIGGSGTGTSGMPGTTSNPAEPGYSAYGHSKTVVTAGLKVSLLKARAGVYVLGKHDQLVRIKADRALDHILKANAKVYVFDPDGALVRIKGKVALAGIRAKAKVYVLDDHDLLRAKAIVALSGKKELKAKVAAKAGTAGATVQVGLSLDERHKPGSSNNGGNNGDDGTNANGVSTAVAALSADERRQLRRKCPSVLASPASYGTDAVMVCRVLAQLSER